MSQITSPEEYFGFRMGTDRKIARWDAIVEYFRLLQSQSDRVEVVDLGPSTDGHPFLQVIITSPENHGRLEILRRVNHRISHPRGLTTEEVGAFVEEGKAVVCQSMSLHATEIGGTQMAPELAHELATRDDAETRLILDRVIFHMIPCFNPDGQIMVSDWYERWLDTEWEGVGPPFLYHRYAGHDNNRDAFMTNLVESRYMAKVMYRDWSPQAYQDHHHMGSYGARLYIAPYSNPIHPHGDPLVWREHSWYGAHMALRLEQAGKTGILNGAVFSGWAHLGFHWIGIYHNCAAMLTESASARLATPLYIHREQLIDQPPSRMVGTRMYPNYRPSTHFPHPWEGGWWRLRDIVEQQKVAAWALLEHMARNKDAVLWNAYHKAQRQTERGNDETPRAYVIPAEQHDALTARLLVEKLLVQGIEIHRAASPFVADGRRYGPGSWVIRCGQPKMGLVKTLLGRTRFPDDPWTREPDGRPSRPYDTATDTMAEFMGVTVEPLEELPDVELDTVTTLDAPEGRVTGGGGIGTLLDGRLNAAYRAVNLLLADGVMVQRIDEVLRGERRSHPPGSFVVLGAGEDRLREVARQTGVDFIGLEALDSERHDVRQARTGMYQRYWGGNMDEGWTRLALEQFDFPYTTLMDEDVKKGKLIGRFDVIILPNDAPAMISGGDELRKWWKERRPGWPLDRYPPEYESGLGEEGAAALVEFVEEGGTLVGLGAASEYAIDKLDLKVANAMSRLSSKEFYCPGSTLRIEVDNAHPLGYGMPRSACALFWAGPAFRILPDPENHRVEVIAAYPERDLLQSGWLVGEERLADKVAMLRAHKGKGSAVLIGFRAQHRCQTHGTFKLLFNCLLS
jgi:hypothetical protein